VKTTFISEATKTTNPSMYKINAQQKYTPTTKKKGQYISSSSDAFSLPYIAFERFPPTQTVMHMNRDGKKKYQERKERKKISKRCNVERDPTIPLDVRIMAGSPDKNASAAYIHT
jgi:hypothetical protein